MSASRSEAGPCPAHSPQHSEARSSAASVERRVLMVAAHRCPPRTYRAHRGPGSTGCWEPARSSSGRAGRTPGSSPRLQAVQDQQLRSVLAVSAVCRGWLCSQSQMYVRLEIAAQASMSCWKGALDGSVCRHAAYILRQVLTTMRQASSEAHERGSEVALDRAEPDLTFFLTVMFGAGRTGRPACPRRRGGTRRRWRRPRCSLFACRRSRSSRGPSRP